MPRRGSCVTAGLRAAWLIIFSLPVFSPANLPIQHDSSWPIRSSKTQKKLYFLDWSGTSLLLEARKSKWREGLRFDTKWWILETNSPILKSIQAKAKSNSTKQSKESEYYMYIFITYFKKITSLNELVRGQLKFTMQEGHEVSKTLRFLSSSMIYSNNVTIKFIKGLF